jgi:predicted  nucleic acid-binding Zn-ribbon protein
MTAASAEQQRQLLALQRVDDAIRRLEQQRANLPEQKALDDNDELLRQVASDYADAAEQLEDAQRVQRTRETDIANLEARRKAEEARLYSDEITSERQVEAIRGELSSIKRKKNDFEEELLEAMERIEQLESRTSELKSRHAELQGKVGELTRERDHAAGDLDAELTEKRAERERVVGELDQGLVRLYEQVRTQQGDVAVAVLDGKACSGCFLQLTQRELEEVRQEAPREIPRCPQCDRLLIVNP